MARVGLKKAFGKECVATQSSTMPPEEVATLKRKVTKDVLEKVTIIWKKMGAPNVDLENIIIEDQQIKHGDLKVSVERTSKRTPEPIIPVAQNPTPQPITTLEAQNPT